MGISRKFTGDKQYLFYWNAAIHFAIAKMKAYVGTLATETVGRFTQAYRTTGVQNDILIFFDPIYLGETKNLTLEVLYTKQSNGGIGQFQLADTTNPTTLTNYGTTFDTYAAGTTHNNLAKINLGTVPAGYSTLFLKAPDKNAASTSYRVLISEIIIYETV